MRNTCLAFLLLASVWGCSSTAEEEPALDDSDGGSQLTEGGGSGGGAGTGGKSQGGTGGGVTGCAGGSAGAADAGDPGDPCASVTCPALSHCENGDCWCNTGYQGDPATGCTPAPDELAALRQELVDIATKEIGVCEGVDSRPYIDAAPGLWCYAFVAWVYNQSSWDLPAPNSLPRHWMPVPPGWRPRPGDLIKYQIQHYGMVVKVDPDDRLYTIEGNSSYCVRENKTWVNFAEEYYGSLEDVLTP